MTRPPAAGARTVVFVSHGASRTGAVIALLHLIRWVRANTDLRVATVLAEDGPLRGEFEAVAPVLLRRGRNWAALKNRFASGLGLRDRIVRRDDRRLARQVAGLAPGVIYANTVTVGELVGRLARSGVPVVTHVHELDFWIRTRVRPEAFAEVLRHTRRFIAVAGAVRDNLVRHHGVPAGRVDLVYEFISAATTAAAAGRDPAGAASLRARLGLPADAVVVGGCGTADWRKGYDLFVQLAAAARRTGPGPPVRFVWVGAGEHDALFEGGRHDAAHAGVADVLTVVPPVPNPHDYFALYDVFVLTSREDPFPLVCLEAAALGKPIVCFAGAGGMQEFVADDAGIVVPYLDVGAMAAAVSRLADDPGLRARLGDQAKGRAVRRHDVDVLAPRVAQIVRSVIDEGRPR